MPSTHKTALFNLNQWLGTDKPKREDFNSDNLNIENGVKSHIQNAVAHISDADRQQWNNSTPTIGNYTGDNSPSRTITLGFRPKLVFLFSADRPFVEYSSSASTNNIFSAACSALGASLGIQLTATGFTVANAATNVAGGSSIRLNQSTKNYIYIVYR